MPGQTINISSEDQYTKVRKTVSGRKKPGKVMRLLVNALEAYRQTRKLGWSRPWNKYGLNTFQSFKLNPGTEPDLQQQLTAVLENDIPMPKSARTFYQDLLADTDKLMAYIFIHEFSENDRAYEGATLSLGRVVDKKFRDRIDLILESEIKDGVSQGFTRMRVYIDPYTETREPLWNTTVDAESADDTRVLFDMLTNISWDWNDQGDRVWRHWTSEYISYFGERQSHPQNAQFYVDGADRPRPETDQKTKKDQTKDCAA